MANWNTYTVPEILNLIEKEELVLPVIQRQLVWTEEQIEMLFNTLMKKHIFGSIITVKDFQDRKPLFNSYRPFIRDFNFGSFVSKDTPEKLPYDVSYVVDGQQRLSAIYIGIKGSYNGKELYFDLLSEYKHNEFAFEFSDRKEKLKYEVERYTDGSKRRTLWYKVKDIFRLLQDYAGEYREVAEHIIVSSNIDLNQEEKETVIRNLERFRDVFITSKVIGVGEVYINRSRNLEENRKEIVELFRRLNQGGTKLSASDLMSSFLKAYGGREIEKFLHVDVNQFEDLGLGQDEIVKYVFILQDNPKKEIANIEESDSKFILENRDRIIGSLVAVRKFLQASGLYNFFKDFKPSPSVIPLYFIGYFVFHKTQTKEQAEKFFDNVESNSDYGPIFDWVFLSLLQKIFRRQRGAGWIAYRTGIRKILEVLKSYKNSNFPKEELFQMYKNHPLRFVEYLSPERLYEYDLEFVFYLIYGGQKFRVEDIDHIHPKSILEKKGFPPEEINVILNYQLLDPDTNRNDKKDMELYEWIDTLPDKESYIKRHLIPNDRNLWKSENYRDFLEKRRELIMNKLKDILRTKKL